MINPHTKFEVSMFTHSEELKGNAKFGTHVDCRLLGHSFIHIHSYSFIKQK